MLATAGARPGRNAPWAVLPALLLTAARLGAAEAQSPFPADPDQGLERTCFQTASPWGNAGNLRSDVAIVYGIDPGLPERLQGWRQRGYRVHVMTGVAWGAYQDYLEGRFDGIKHQDEAQTDRGGTPHRHGGSQDIFYMCPGTNYGRFLCVGIQRALDAGAEAIHLEEPEFWVQDGYEGGFRREWRNSYGQEWQPPHSSVDAQWRASKLKYFLYRRALQQVFDYVQDYNHRTGRHVRCYVPTHSLINYAHWRIVSPESSLGRLDGCDGYIAQVWTGTARTPNVYQGRLRERTFETAFLEYGAMQNLVRATGRRVWYLNDPVEDNPEHDWPDYKANWESTLTASLFQPEVWRFEVAPWPERVFAGRYPVNSAAPKPIPAAYATELQTVFNALNELRQGRVRWDCGTPGIGVLISDSLMFERGGPAPSDPNLSHFYGLALPLLKRGVPVAPVQLENLPVPHCLDSFRLLVLTYQGMKPLSAEVHDCLARWVKGGGVLVVCDDDSDPFNKVREWWNSAGLDYATPRQHLFAKLGLTEQAAEEQAGQFVKVGKGGVIWRRENPARIAAGAGADEAWVQAVGQGAGHAKLKWRLTNYLLLRRGPFVVASGLDESISGPAEELHGRFVNLFDPELQVQRNLTLAPASRLFVLDLDRAQTGKARILASACKALPLKGDARSLSWTIEGITGTDGIALIHAPRPPRVVRLAGHGAVQWEYSAAERLAWIRFPNESRPRELEVGF
ncbi:MAG: hypothetical protein ACLQU6_05740 [Limisphaerales bacterium]